MANNYVNDNGGIEESLMAGGDTGVGQAGGAAGVASGNEGVSGVVSGNGGVTVGPTQPGGPSPAQGQISQNIKSKLSGEDPLFTAMAGDSKEFVGGIPKETWDAMTPEQRDRFVRGSEEERQEIAEYGAGIGGMAGFLASIPAYSAGPWAGGTASGALSGIGAARGYNRVYNHYNKATAPSPVGRDQLKQQYEEAKNYD